MSSFPQIILASQSPARAELLKQIHLPFITIPSEIDEDEVKSSSDPAKYVLVVSQRKVDSVASRFEYEQKNCIVIGCDTVVISPTNAVLGKPKNRDEAEIMLQTLSGKSHTVLTGCTINISPNEIKHQTVGSTLVKFRKLSEDEINYYLKKGEWQNRAGGYAIQGLGAFLISDIKGDYYNIVGLPVSWIWQTLWEHLGKSLFSK